MTNLRDALSPRERAIVGWIREGRTTADIAARLGVDSTSVELAFVNIRHRLGAPGQADPLKALTPRERAVVAAVREGRTTREIAAQLGASVGTVESHYAAIQRKLEA